MMISRKIFVQGTSSKKLYPFREGQAFIFSYFVLIFSTSRKLWLAFKGGSLRLLNSYIILTVFSCFWGGNASAENTKDDSSFSQTLKKSHSGISSYISSQAELLDLFLAKKEYLNRKNHTEVTIYNSANLREGGIRKYHPHLGVKLDLPNLQKKWQLQFTTYDVDGTERGISRNRRRESKDDSLGTSLGFFGDIGSVKTAFRPMIEFRPSMETSYLLSFSNSSRFEWVRLLPELQFFARSDTGTGEFFAINTEITSSPKTLIILICEEQYTEVDNTLSTNHGFRFTYNATDHFSSTFGTLLLSHNRPVYHLDEVAVSWSFDHEILPNIFKYSLVPSVSYPKATHFNNLWGFDLNFSFIF